MEPKRGQEYRDRVRCEAMQKMGYDVYTLDDKHDDVSLDHKRHCTANFADARRCLKAMRKNWGTKSFDHIVLDYFFCPEGWAKERWTEGFFKLTLPKLAQEGILSQSGSIWLPNLKCVDDLLIKYEALLDEHFIWDVVPKANMNPLFKATNKVEKELLSCPDSLTNETQLLPLDDCPFIILKHRHRKRRNLALDSDEDIPIEASAEPVLPANKKHRTSKYGSFKKGLF